MSMGSLTSLKPASFMGFWNYNRTNYEFDIGMRMKRFTAGRAMAVKQAGMFRDDVADLTMVPVKKMNIYTPIATVCAGYCVTVYIEGRSGLKFPAPPTFISGIYLQCLGIGFCFMGLAAWMVFHAGMRACVAAVQLRTRTVRLPLPTQRQLDQARKLASSYEETSLYDMFRVPYIMPNLADTPDHSADDDDPDFAGNLGGEPSAKKLEGKKGGKNGDAKGKVPPPSGKKKRKSTRMPYRSGNPEWIEREYEHYDENPKSAPSAYGNGPAVEPYEHFEILRKAQKDWWGAEVYGRICMLTGQIHLIQGFGYWLTIHCIAELGMYWSAQVLAASYSAAIWLLFHLDVLPDKGGFWPVEAAGPFLSALTLLLQYSHSPTQFTLNLSRVMAICVIILNIVFSIRLLMIATPSNLLPGHAREMGNQKNLSASCEHPAWLPTAYQHVSYLVAPPKSAKDPKLNSDEKNEDDPMEGVEMLPWKATRGMYFATIGLWFVLLVGRIVECATGERALMTSPGYPPWTRIGQWDGWESGPITSKHYAHVTPMRGHFAWKYGQGPNGYVEIWPSDLFGFAPEADMWWADENNPDRNAPPGKAEFVIPSYPLEVIPAPPHKPAYDTPDYGKHHRRLQKDFLQADVTRPLVPAAVKWPSLIEPDLIACAPSGQVAAFSAIGHGAMVSEEAASGKASGVAAPFSLEGLPAQGFARGVTWGHDGLTVVSGHGTLHSCAHVASSKRFTCQNITGPALPLPSAVPGREGPLPAVAVGAGTDGLRFAAVAMDGGEVHLMHLGMSWEFMAKVQLPVSDASIVPERPSVVALSASEDHLIVTAADGATYRWQLRAGLPASSPHREAPAAASAYAAVGSPRTWRGACALPTGKIIRLASRWQKSGGAGALAWHPELLF
jgi:hypothetical protein